jgi:hypothetical protein
MNVEMLLFYQKWVAKATHKVLFLANIREENQPNPRWCRSVCTTSSTRKIHGQQLLRAASHICRI